MMKNGTLYHLPSCSVYDKYDNFIGTCESMDTYANSPKEAMRNFHYRYNKTNHRPTYDPVYFSTKMIATDKK